MAYYQEYNTKKGKLIKITVSAGINPATGKPKQITRRGFKTKKEARAAVAQIEYELGQGTFVDEKNITFTTYATEWFEAYAANVKESTARARRNSIKIINRKFGKGRMKDITPRIYQLFINELFSAGYKRSTITNMNVVARMIFKQAEAHGVIKNDPTDGVVLPKQRLTVEELENKKEIPRFLEKEELSVFLETAREQGLECDYEINTLQSYTGLRSGELVALKWGDIDFENKSLRVTKTLFSEDKYDEYKLLTPKTDKSVRTIKIDDFVIDMLQEYKQQQNRLIMRYRNSYKDEGFVFARTTLNKGYPRTIKMLQMRFKRLMNLSGLQLKLTPHSLRHTHTTLLAEAGVSLPEIQERLGHFDDKITTMIYLHTTKAMKDKSAEKFSDLMKTVRK